MWSPRSLDNAGRDTATLTSRYITPVTTTPSPGHRLFKYFFRMDSSPHQLLPGHPGGACKSKVKRICEWLLQVLLSFLCLQLVTIEAICNDGEERYPQAPECLDCQGRRFFLGIDQLCKMCIQCQPGYEHDKECGNGVNGDAVCVQCPEDHYSYNLYDCVACRVCENTLITQECSVSTDRQCGECLPGFYKDPQNPDLCNQRCEWLSNPETIPACKEWLEGQQVTSLSADISMMSSFPGIIDEGIGRQATIIIIIIVLVVVIIGGSVIPVYMFCKHFKYTRSKRTGVLLAASGDTEGGNPREHPHLADGETPRMPGVALPLPTGQQHDGTGGDVTEQVRVSGLVNSVPLSTGPQQDNASGNVTEMGGAPIMQGAPNVVVDNTVPLANGPEEENNCIFIKNDDKDHDKSVLNVFDSAYSIAYPPNDLSLMSDSQEEVGRENENSIVPDVNAGVLENECSADQFYPSPNSHGGKFENNLEGAQALRSTESNGISPGDNVQRPRGLDFKGTQGTLSATGNDEQDGEAVTGQEEPDENQRLLPDGSQESPVISQVEDEHMPACQDSERGGRCEGEEGEKDGNEEGREEHDTLLQNAQVEDIGKGASHGNDEKWRGSAEDESSEPKKKKKAGASTTNTVRLPSCNCGKTTNVTLNIGNVKNLVLNDQINHHHHHNGECQPSSGDDDDELDEV